MSIDTSAYPLLFEPIYKAKVWGGRTLEKLGRDLPAGDIGESWELVDLATTSASGGGGGSERSVVTNGPMKGKAFHDIIANGPDATHFRGHLPLNEFGEFPLLVKFLDANDNLSVQVHPSAEYAATHDDAYLKSEAWYVLDREPGACIYKGIVAGTTKEAFRKAIENDEVEKLMIRVPVEPGDCHYLPSGTCHALGAGVLVAEVQTPSDTTFRVYDWGRKGRELHVEPALACIDFGHPPPTSKPTHIEGPYGTIDRLVNCEYFRIDRVQLAKDAREPLQQRQPLVWMVLAGAGVIEHEHGRDDVGIGRTLYLPPQMTGVTLTVSEPMTLLEVSFPQADSGAIA